MSVTGAINIYYVDHAEDLDAAMDQSNIHPDDVPYLSRLAEAGLDDISTGGIYGGGYGYIRR
jgi:hypothetical protein